MDYHCKYCDYWFFMEEGYDAEEDAIKCPCCGAYVEEN